uniref:Uncharacterized protein n=1 Tax=Arundo donax TaxID=35708 RepID=A0A0A9G9N3_ARUDO
MLCIAFTSVWTNGCWHQMNFLSYYNRTL